MAARGLLHHLRNYGSAAVLSTLAGVVTFPLFTRSLTVDEYGILGLTMSSVTLFVILGKLGMQHAVIRFFSPVRAGDSTFSLSQFHSSVFLVFFALAMVASTFWLLIGFFVVPIFSDNQNLVPLLLVAGALVFIRVLMSSFNNLLRADQQSGVVSIALIITRFSLVCIVLTALLFTDLSPVKILVFTFLADVLVFVYLVLNYPPSRNLKISDYSAQLVKTMAVYAVPLMMVELLGTLLRLCDRYLIEAYLGVMELGQYSASYNLVNYLNIIVVQMLVQAIKPMYLQLWEYNGVAATSDFLSIAFHKYLILGIPFIAIFSLTAPHLLNFLASPKYAPGSIVIPFIALSFFVEAASSFASAGLYVARKSRAILYWALAALVVNLALNALFIPKFGLVGASVATVIAVVFYGLGTGFQAFRTLSFSIRLKEPAVMVVVSIVVYFALLQYQTQYEWLTFFVKGAIGVLILLPIVLIVDTEIRQWVWHRTSLIINRAP